MYYTSKPKAEQYPIIHPFLNIIEEIEKGHFAPNIKDFER
jgi:hypothetical protein